MLIKTLEDINKDGFQIVHLKVNREVDEKSKNVKAKMESIKKHGIIYPLYLTPASRAYNEGLEMVTDDDTEVDEELAKKAYLVCDGNNRRFALMKIREKPDEAGEGLKEVKCLIDDSMENILSKIMEMNNQNVKWSFADYSRTANLMRPQDEDINFINELKKDKYPPSTISLLCCFKKGEITEKLIADLACEPNKKLPTTFNRERAIQIIETVKEVGFSEKFIKSRFLIEAILDIKRDKDGIELETILDCIKKLKSEAIKKIEGSHDFDGLKILVDSQQK